MLPNDGTLDGSTNGSCGALMAVQVGSVAAHCSKTGLVDCSVRVDGSDGVVSRRSTLRGIVGKMLQARREPVRLDFLHPTFFRR